MKNIKVLFIVVLFGLGSCTQSSGPQLTSNAPGAATSTEAVENEFMVKGEKSEINKVMSEMNLNANIETFNKRLNLHAVRYSGKASYAQIAEKLAPKVAIIEQNSKVSIHALEKKVEWPEDRYFFYQWAFNNIGQSAPWGLPGKYDADIKLLQALKEFGGKLKEKAIVAVIDTGVDYSHEDLNANMWVNEAESKKMNGVAGKDDDGNGYTDDVHGYDFTSSARLSPHYGKIGDPDPNDESGHGSHCAGSIGAVPNNQKGISGVNPMVQIMALRALSDAGGTTSDINRAISYATENGANVISASFGGSEESEITKDLIRDAGEQGILFVAAAGNDGKTMELKNNRKFPASYQLDNLLTVGASDNMDNPALFSNYGPNYVDVYAPGVGILSLYKDGGLTIMDGTSMAAPIAAGVASLIMSAYPQLKQNPKRVKEIILATVDRSASMYGKVASNGRINALKALQQADSAVQTSPLAWQEEPYPIEQKGYNTELVDIRYEVKKAGAKALRLHFDFMEIDRGFDSVYIYDKDFTLVSEIQNGSTRDLWSPVINGDTAIVRFVNAKVKRQSSPMSVKMNNSDIDDCLAAGGENAGPVVTDDPTKAHRSFVCLQDNMEYTYEDLQKDIDDSDVFFSWQSEGFSIDKIQFTETSI